MDFTTVIKERFSCKKYNGKQISQEQLQEILEAGQAAPTAKNLQEWHVYVAQKKETLALIDEHTPCRYNAPTVLIVTYNKENVFNYPGGKSSSGAEDASIVATHLMLAAYNAKVDSGWLNCVDPEKLAASLKLPENEEILMLLDLGFASDEGKPLPNHFSRKDLSETVSYI